MSIGMKKWRHEVFIQGPYESWDYLTERVTGRFIRSHQTEPEPPWVLNPDYQQGPVWTEQQQSRFIGHVLAGGIQPPIYVQQWRSHRFCPEEVIDGQQRLRAIAAFMSGEIPAEVYHDGEWHTYWRKDMNKKESSFMKLSTMVVYMDISRADRLRFYLLLNSGGTPHTEEELDRVRALLIQEEEVEK